jgi:hypothetical protein
MEKITQMQIVEAAHSFARQKLGAEHKDTQEFADVVDGFKKAVKWCRMAVIDAITGKNHPDSCSISEMTSSDTIKLYVDNWPEILDFLRTTHPHRYVTYGDCITVFCNDKKHRKVMTKLINEVRSIKD